jgi:hypothetical protein
MRSFSTKYVTSVMLYYTDRHFYEVIEYNVCHVCDAFTTMSVASVRSLSTMSVTSVGGTGGGCKFLPLNFNTSFQFVFHKRTIQTTRSLSLKMPQDLQCTPKVRLPSLKLLLFPSLNRACSVYFRVIQ